MATVVLPEIGNNGLTLLNGGINGSVTTVNVDSAAALTLDNSTTDAYITVIDPTTFGKNPFSTPETQEIMQVTGVSTNALTVVRGVDGTSGTVFADNSYVMLRNNAATLQRVYDALTDGNDSLSIDALEVSGDITPDVLREMDIGTAALPFGDARVTTLEVYPSNAGAQPTRMVTLNGEVSGTTSANIFRVYLPDGSSVQTLVAQWSGDKNLICLGGVEVRGDLTLGATGCNKTWESPLLQPGQEIIAAAADPPTAIGTKVYAANRREVPVATCNDSVTSRMVGVVSMPDDYDGTATLEYDIYFTVANTNSGNVFWYVTASADDAGDDLANMDIGAGTHAEAAPGTVNQLVTATGTFTPNSAANLPGQLVFFSVARLGAHASDTYTASGDHVYFIGMKLKYA